MATRRIILFWISCQIILSRNIPSNSCFSIVTCVRFTIPPLPYPLLTEEDVLLHCFISLIYAATYLFSQYHSKPSLFASTNQETISLTQRYYGITFLWNRRVEDCPFSLPTVSRVRSLVGSRNVFFNGGFLFVFFLINTTKSASGYETY